MNEFEQLNAAKEHAEEIKTSRVGGLLRILGDEEKLQKFVARAFASGKNRTDCKVYGGVRISFYTF